MTINGISFAFSPDNASHLERADEAVQAYQTAHAANRALADGTLRGNAAFLRADNAAIRSFLDTLLGDGAALALGWDADDHAICLALLQQVCDAIRGQSDRGA